MDLDVASGTIHAIVGENGAGKSTLMKALAGAIRPDAGSISIDGRAVELASARAARENGIGIVYQELSILPDRPLLANLFVNREPTRFGLVATREMERRARPVLARLGLDVDLDVPVGTVSIAERQLIELARVLLEQPSVLILDEPNSALNDRETQRLFTILRELAGEGITVLYVSHRLEEVFQIADRVTVMRDGREILTRDTTALTIPEVVEAMVGTKQEDLFPARTGSRRRRRRGARCRRVDRRHRARRRQLRGPARRDRRARRNRRIRHRTAARNAVRRAPGVGRDGPLSRRRARCRRAPRGRPGDGSASCPPTVAPRA